MFNQRPYLRQLPPELALILKTLQSSSTDIALSFTNTAIDWQFFFKLVCHHRVWHPVGKALQPLLQENLDYPIIAKLTNLQDKDSRQLLLTASETIRISRALTQCLIAHCFVKGTLLNVHIYGGINTRSCRDIDVWVTIANYAEAAKILLQLGYQQQYPNYALHGFKKNYYLRHKHDVAFYHPEHKIIIELHFRLNYFGIDFFPFNQVPLVPIPLFNTAIMAPEDNYHLLYLMIHGAIHAWNRLRWLHDIALYIQSKRCDLTHIWSLSVALKCTHIVEQTLLLLDAYFAEKLLFIQPFIRAPSRRSIKLFKIAQVFINNNYDMNDGIRHPRMFLAYRVYLFTLAVRGQKAQAIFGDLFKIDKVFSRFTFSKYANILYYMIYPVWIIRYLSMHLKHRCRKKSIRIL